MDTYESKLATWSAVLEEFPILRGLAQTPQDPYYHGEGNVLIHTEMVYEALKALPAYQALSESDKYVLRLAAVLHDIAKATCTVQDYTGKWISPGHSKRGAVDARNMLWRKGVAFTLREMVCNLIAVHQVPFHAFTSSNPDYLARKIAEDCRIDLLAILATADILGRKTPDVSLVLDNIELFGELGKELGCYRQPYPFPDARTRVAYFRSEGSLHADTPFYKEAGSSVIVLSGMPASGKDSWAAKNGKGLPVISYDDAREELGLAHGKNAGAAIHLAKDRAKELLRKKAPFIWNATHLSTQMRGKTLDLLYSYGAIVEIVYLEADVSTIQSRNHKRDSSITFKDIENMLFKWEPPSSREAESLTLII